MRRQMVLAAVIFISALLAAKFLLPYAAPFIIALFAVIVLEPLVNHLERLGIGRALASFLLVFSFFAGSIGLISLLLTALWQEVNHLQEASQWLEASSELFHRLQSLISDLPYPLSETGPIIAERIRSWLAHFGNLLVSVITAIPDGLFVWFIAAMSAFFICRDRATFSKGAARLLPKQWDIWVRRLTREVTHGVLAYLRVQLILVTLSAGLTIVFLHLIGIRYAVALGLLTGLLDFLPGVGPSGVYIPLVIGQGIRGRYDLAAACAAAGLILFVIRQVWEPQLVRSQIGVHPLAATAAIYIGFRLFGIAGLILGPLFAILAKALYRTALTERK